MRINILNKQGMLSSEDRKEKFVHRGDHFEFTTCLDLSSGVIVTSLGSREEHTLQQYSNDLATFISYWNHFVKKDLNGFSGFSHIKFKLENITLIP